MLSSQKPYLLRAMYEWMVDNQLIPHIVIGEPAKSGHVVGVPAHLLEQDNLTLNISPTATQFLSINKNYIEFHARFAGQSHHVLVAIAAVVAIYDRDSQQGLSFSLKALTDNSSFTEARTDENDNKVSKPKPSHLKIVK